MLCAYIWSKQKLASKPSKAAYQQHLGLSGSFCCIVTGVEDRVVFKAGSIYNLHLLCLDGSAGQRQSVPGDGL